MSIQIMDHISKQLARILRFSDGEDPGPGLTTNAILLGMDRTGGVHRQLTCDTNGVQRVVPAPGDSFTLEALSAHAVAGTFTTPVLTGMSKYRRLIFQQKITASATAAADVLDVYIDVSIDGGTTWLNAIHFTQQAGNGSAVTQVAILDPSNPGTATIAVTSDAASGAVRPAVWGDAVRGRYVLVNNTAVSHTFGLTAYGQY